MPDAIAASARAPERAPAAARSAYVSAIALESQGATEPATAELERAPRRHPGRPDRVAPLATLNQKRGDRDAALGWARKLVELAPENAQARALLESIDGAGGAP
jgi:Flp pilus assembly protein TadD